MIEQALHPTLPGLSYPGTLPSRSPEGTALDRRRPAPSGSRRSLERALGQARARAERGEPVLLGPVVAHLDGSPAPGRATAPDPYHPSAHRVGATRALLANLLHGAVSGRSHALGKALEDGIELHLATRWTGVVEDVDLLARLDRSSVVTVDLLVPCMDAGLARRIETPPSNNGGNQSTRTLLPSPTERLEAAARLAEAGIATRLVVRPLLSWINNDEDVLRPLFEAARDAGVIDVVAAPLSLEDPRGARRGTTPGGTPVRERFFPWLRREFPELTPWYRRLYGHRDDLGKGQRDELLAPFRRLCLEYGFPRSLPGRG